MDIFVSGGTGVVGWRAVKALSAGGHDVSVLARSPEKARLVESLGARPVEADLFDPASLKAAIEGHEVVVNLATKIPSISEGRKPSAWTENSRIRSEGSRNLVDAALATGASRYIQESIAFLYGDHGDAWIDEDEPLIATPFTASVRDAEANAARFTEGGGTGVVLRFGMFYATDSDHTASMFRFARRGWYLLPGDPGKYSPWINIDDAAAAVVAALDVPAGSYNVVDDVPMTLRESADAMAAAVGRKRLRTAPRFLAGMVAKRAPQLVPSQRVSNRRFRDATGWRPAYPSLAEGLPAVYAKLEPVRAR